MSDFLKEIIKIKEVEIKKYQTSSLDLKTKFRQGKLLIIAEIKLATPTIKKLGCKEDVIPQAKRYEKAGADMISVVTEKKFFKGDLAFVSSVKESGVKLPILHKDFVIDSLQVYHSKFTGADAVLLIAKIVDIEVLKELVALANKLGVEPIVEINDTEDLKKVLQTKTTFIAVNARDLNTFKINIQKACALLRKIPDDYIKLAFSGVNSKEEIAKYTEAGAKGVLIGTSLMKAKDIEGFLRGLKI